LALKLSDYLERIEYSGAVEASPIILRHLHLAHLYSVPFENLDIHLGVPIRLDLEKIYSKIVQGRRGGFCYELNGLFAWLLESIGFTVTLLSASDALADGSYGPEFDHLVLKVNCPSGSSDSYLADVGWGDSFVEPLLLDESREQPQGLRAYRVEHRDEFRMLWQRNYDGMWEEQYRFTLQPRRYADFEAMCLYHQTSSASHFTRKRICTRATRGGRVSLDDHRLIVTQNGERREAPVTSQSEYRRLLAEIFGFDLPLAFSSGLPYNHSGG
jgi:N-hydroxyarylamine O-acetyltransferase